MSDEAEHLRYEIQRLRLAYAAAMETAWHNYDNADGGAVSEWTEGRTWTRVERGETRREDALIRITRELGRSTYAWEVIMVDAERPGYGLASSLREAKAQSYAEWLVMTGRLIRARGGA